MIDRSVRLETRVLVALSVLLVAYDAARASIMSITYDEAWTYIWHVSGRIGDVLRFATPGLPDNNHLLLTILAKFSIGLFGDSDLALRLPSVLAFALFCAAVAAILRRHLHGPLLVLFFLFTTLNPDVIDMMSIARGYGLGIALATAGIYGLMRAAEPGVRRAVWASAAVAAFALAVLAHLSLLLLYAMALVILLAVLLLDDRHGRIGRSGALRVAAGPALISALLTPVALMQIHVLAPLGLLNTEGLTSFFVDTVQKVVADSLYLDHPMRGAATALCIFVYALPAAGLLLLLLPRRIVPLSPAARTDLAMLLTLLLGASLLSVAQHHLAGVAYLSGRRALSLFSPFALLCASIAAACRAGSWPLRRIALPALIAVVLPLTVNFARSANLHRTRDWTFNADTKAMLADLAKLRAGPLQAETPDHPARLGINWVFDAPITYYRIRDRLTEWGPVDRSGPLGPFDAYYVFAGELPSVEKVTGPLRVIRQYALSGTILAVPEASSLGRSGR